MFAGGIVLLFLLVLLSMPPGSMGQEPSVTLEMCTTCHQEEGRFAPLHRPALIGCTGCHGGKNTGVGKVEAHAGMDSHPGQLANLERTCGRTQCHVDQMKKVRNSIMHTLDGMIELTRSVLGERQRDDRHKPLGERLGQSGVDSYLRKMCVSCHLGAKIRKHTHKFEERGGGCNACHLLRHKGTTPSAQASSGAPQSSQEKLVRTGIHPTLTLAIDNERCFGCHSRSGRISLNYVGLAETQKMASPRPEQFARLHDGRLVRRLPKDVHARGGLSCIDCHTGPGLMGHGQRERRQQAQVDIGCDDCHAPKLREAAIGTFPWRLLARPLLHGWQTPDLERGRVVVTARRNTPLYHLYRRPDGTRIMRSKLQSGEAVVPVRLAGPHHDLEGHERLTCQACHAAWAPQCDGCHISYDPKGRQVDHLLQKATPGRWLEKSWSVRSDPPALGVRSDGKIAPFVPGMSLIFDPPDGGAPLRQIVYSRIAPHTTQAKSRTCEACHRDKSALGIILGETAAPWNQGLKLPLGWVREDAQTPAAGLHEGDRSLNLVERARIGLVGRCLACHPGQTPWYSDFSTAKNSIGLEKSHRGKWLGKQQK